jgi:hypothetical protein
MTNAPLSREGSFRLDAPMARVLPMFTPQGERAWAPGWDPHMLSGDTGRGSAFRTTGANGVESVWIVTAFEPEHGRAGYARIAQGSNIGLVDVACTPVGDAATEVSVRYTLTGLDAAGDAFAREFLAAERYDAFLDAWRGWITQALARDAA